MVDDGQGDDDDAEVRVDGFAWVVVDRSGLQVVLGHPQALLDVPELVVGVAPDDRDVTLDTPIEDVGKAMVATFC